MPSRTTPVFLQSQLPALLAGLLVIGFLPTASAGPVPSGKPTHHPDWWFIRDVIPLLPNASPPLSWPASYPLANDFAAANIGQLKLIARRAYDELKAKLPAELWTTSSGQALHSLVRSWYLDDQLTQLKTSGSDDYAALNLGQLKYVASHFYNLLDLVAYSDQPLGFGYKYPWTAVTRDDENYALANLGQVKRVFSFQPAVFDGEEDLDGDGLDDGWEIEHWGNLDQGAFDDPDGDGFANWVEFAYQSDPTVGVPSGQNPLPAAHYNVDPSVTQDTATMFSTIGAAVRAALAAAAVNPPPSPRIIKIAPGHYAGPANTRMVATTLENILLIADTAGVVIDGEGELATGFSLGNNSGFAGVGIHGLSDGITVRGDHASIVNCTIQGTGATATAALYLQDADSFTLHDSTMKENQTRALYIHQSDMSLNRVAIQQNATSGTGAALFVNGGGSLAMENCLITGNSSAAGGAVLVVEGLGNIVDIVHCTVVENQGAQAAVFLRNLPSVTVINSIFWNESSPAEFGGSLGSLHVTYSTARGGRDGEGNSALDPLLTEGGYPKSDSPVLDQGTFAPGLDHDINLSPRPQGAGVDMGAFEFLSAATQLPDWWKIQHFGTTLVDPNADPDQDGKTNLEEFNAGTDPRDSLDGTAPVITVVAGHGQHGQAGQQLAAPITVMVTGPGGVPAANIALRITARDANARLSATPSPTGTPAAVLETSTAANGEALIYVTP